MPLEERMATFQFVYDDEGPHLNPSIMEMLKPEVGFGHELLTCEAPLPVGAGERLNGLLDSTSLDRKLQVEERYTFSQDLLAPVFTLCLHRVQVSEAPGEPVVATTPNKKRRKTQQPQSPPTKTVRRRKWKNDDNTSDPMKKRKPRQVPPTTADPASAAGTTTGEKVKRRKKKSCDDEEVAKKSYSSGKYVTIQVSMLCDFAVLYYYYFSFLLSLVTADSRKPQSDSAAENSQQSKRRRRIKKDAEKEVKPAVIGGSQLTIFQAISLE